MVMMIGKSINYNRNNKEKTKTTALIIVKILQTDT